MTRSKRTSKSLKSRAFCFTGDAESFIRVILSVKRYELGKRVVVNEAEISSAFEALGTVNLSKQLTSPGDETSVALCEKVARQRSIAKWMDFNYFYVFDVNKVKKKAKAVDDMIPYEFFVDLR